MRRKRRVCHQRWTTSANGWTCSLCTAVNERETVTGFVERVAGCEDLEREGGDGERERERETCRRFCDE